MVPAPASDSSSAPRRLLRKTLGIIALAAVFLLGYEIYRVQSAANALAAIRDANRKTEQDLVSLARRTDAEVASAIKLEASLAEKERTSAQGAAIKAARLARGEQFLADNPQWRAKIREAMKYLAASWVAHRARAAGFSDAQIAAYEEIFTHQRMPIGFATFDVPAVGDYDPHAQDTSLKALVGEDLYKRYLNQDQASRASNLRISTIETFEDSGAALTDSQRDAVLALAKSSTDIAGQIDWVKFQPAAEGLLSPQQQAVVAQNVAAAAASAEAAAYTKQLMRSKSGGGK